MEDIKSHHINWTSIRKLPMVIFVEKNDLEIHMLHQNEFADVLLLADIRMIVYISYIYKEP